MGDVENFYKSLNGGRTCWSTQNMNEMIYGILYLSNCILNNKNIYMLSYDFKKDLLCQLELLYTKMWKFAEKSNASVTMSIQHALEQRTIEIEKGKEKGKGNTSIIKRDILLRTCIFSLSLVSEVNLWK